MSLSGPARGVSRGGPAAGHARQSNDSDEAREKPTQQGRTKTFSTYASAYRPRLLVVAQYSLIRPSPFGEEWARGGCSVIASSRYFLAAERNRLEIFQS